MPQWDFLNFLTEHASRYPPFKVRMQAEVTGLLEEDGRVVGLEATTPMARWKCVPASSSVQTAGTRSSGRRPACR